MLANGDVRPGDILVCVETHEFALSDLFVTAFRYIFFAVVLCAARVDGQRITERSFLDDVAEARVPDSLIPRSLSLSERVLVLYRPLVGEQITLSPDGHSVAYTQHENGRISVVVRNVDEPEPKNSFVVAEDKARAGSSEKRPAQVKFLRWITPGRLLVQTSDLIFRVDADGRNVRKLVDRNDLAGSIALDPMILQQHGFSSDSATPEVSTVDPSVAHRMALENFGNKMREGATADGGETSSRKGRALADAMDEYNEEVEGVPNDPDRPDERRDAIRELMEKPRTVPRTLRAIGLLTDGSKQLLVEAVGEPPDLTTGLFKVDVETGKTTELGEQRIPGTIFYTQQGEARLIHSQQAQAGKRFFLYRTPSGKKKWIRFDKVSNEIAALKFVTSAENHLGERTFPLGFDFDAQQLYFASNVGRETYGIYRLNLTDGRRSVLLENPHYDLTGLEPVFPSDALVFDERQHRLAGVNFVDLQSRTQWFDPEIGVLQTTLERKFSGRTVKILQWSDDRDRFLFLVSGGPDSGRYYVFERQENIVVELLRRVPGLQTSNLQPAKSFEFDTPAGVHLSGYLTFPRTSRFTPPPLLGLLPQWSAATGAAWLRPRGAGHGRDGVHRGARQLSGLVRLWPAISSGDPGGLRPGAARRCAGHDCVGRRSTPV